MTNIFFRAHKFVHDVHCFFVPGILLVNRASAINQNFLY